MFSTWVVTQRDNVKLHIVDVADRINFWDDTITNLWYGLTDLPMVWFSRDDGTPDWWVSIVDGAMYFDSTWHVALPTTTLSTWWDFTMRWRINEDVTTERHHIFRKGGQNLFLECSGDTYQFQYFVWSNWRAISTTRKPAWQWVFVVAKYVDNGDSTATISIRTDTDAWVSGVRSWIRKTETNTCGIWAQAANLVRPMRWFINNFNIVKRELSDWEVDIIYNAWKDAYSPITDWLVAQYSGRDFAWTEENPTTIYDTNWIWQISPTDTRTILAWRWGQYLNYGWVLFTPSDSYTVLANYRLNDVTTAQSVIARMTWSDAWDWQPAFYAYDWWARWALRSTAPADFNIWFATAIGRQQVSSIYEQGTWDMWIYKNAILEESETFTGTMQSGSANTIIGAKTDSTSDDNLIADMESLAIPDFALTPTLIKSWYDKVRV